MKWWYDMKWWYITDRRALSWGGNTQSPGYRSVHLRRRGIRRSITIIQLSHIHHPYSTRVLVQY